MSAPESPRLQVGWDIGGAHVKACLLAGGALRDVAQWPCPLWQGMEHLDRALDQAQARWSSHWRAGLDHAATMTGEMVDLFADRSQGVARIATHLAQVLGPSLVLFDGSGGWRGPQDAARAWRGVASANWQATARVVAAQVGDGVLVDIGSTTTDLIPLRQGRVVAQGTSDAERLESGELVYQGVVRTPLCALAPRVTWRGRTSNVMHEFFATTADVYRLTGELAPGHDQAPPADNAGKDGRATHARLARMVGRDVGDASAADWLALARCWKEAQLADIEGQLRRVCNAARLPAAAPVIGAGCGAFLAAQLAQRCGRPFRRYAEVALPGTQGDEALAAWADVCAPAVSVALLASARG